MALTDLAGASALDGDLGVLRGRSVMIAARDPLIATLALVELEGVARRMVICTPDLTADQLRGIGEVAEADAVVHDEGTPPEAVRAPIQMVGRIPPRPGKLDRERSVDTEWILLTSGTSGEPKLVAHSLQSLAGALPAPSTAPGALTMTAGGGADTVWSTFYDIRRYGGLQIFLRAVIGDWPLVLSSPAEPLDAFLQRLSDAGVTHISGTPSHWRRVLMSGSAQRISPRYVRLSGEIADQSILDGLRAAYPAAVIAHAFASTEAGVAFDVADGKAGFPAELLTAAGPIDLKVVEGTLRIRSARNAARYLGPDAAPLVGADGYVDTGDIVELRNSRYYFLGRRGGVINVGGLKVHPEEVEAVINADARVRMSLVRARRNSITGAVVVAEVVLNTVSGTPSDIDSTERVKRELIAACRRHLPPHKVPTSLRFVAALEFTAAGKLVRPGE